MRFCMVTTFYPPYSFGGDATYVRALSRELVKRGHHVEVIASTDAYRLRGAQRDLPIDDDDGVTVHRLTTGTGPLAPLLVQQTGQPMMYRAELGRLMNRDFDVIHFHNISLVGGPGILDMGRAKLRLYSLHEHWLVCPTHIFWKNRSHACDVKTCFSCSIRSGIPPQLWRYGGHLGRALRSLDLMLSPSRYTAERHREDGIFVPIQILPLFSSIDPGPASDISVVDGTFIFCGRVTASKGVDQLLRVAAKNDGAKVKIVGAGDAADMLRNRYELYPNIQFLGRIPQQELARHYASASAVILPSHSPETFGLAVVEAAAFSTPAIVSAGSGGAAEIVSSSGGGLVYSGDAELERAMAQLATDRALRDALGGRAKAAYAEIHNAERHLASYLSIVNEQLAKRQSASERT